MKQYDMIQDGYMQLGRSNAEELANLTGYSYDEISGSLELIDGASFESQLSHYEDIESSYSEYFGDAADSELNLEGLENLILDPKDTTYIGNLTSAKKAKSVTTDIRSGGTLYSSVLKTIDGEKQYSTASLNALHKELRTINAHGVPGIASLLDSFADNNPDYKGNPRNYIPNPDEMELVKDQLQSIIESWIDPEAITTHPTISSYMGGMHSGMYNSKATGKRGIGSAIGMADAYDEAQLLWTNYINRWNQLRKAENLQEVAFGRLDLKQ